ncbi:MAG: SprT-like family protein [Gemmatimonadota bacterium]|nr:SprT-like family protein [Gemmatimonadota bacterium]
MLTRVLLTSDPGKTRIQSWTRDIGQRLLRASPYACEPDFTRIHPDDLSFLFSAYDERFLDGLCGKVLGPGGVFFRLSSRMTRAGGKTTLLREPDGVARFEIAVATSILFDGFADGDPEVSVGGLVCRHRLDALQRLFEHELVHLAEWLCWDESHCGRKRFQDIAFRLFLQRAHTHRLITRPERAAAMGISVGALVTFRYRGKRLQGRVNRVTKRATVLVEDPEGTRWSDGRRYVGYYVPLGGLRPVAAGGDQPTGQG